MLGSSVVRPAMCVGEQLARSSTPDRNPRGSIWPDPGLGLDQLGFPGSWGPIDGINLLIHGRSIGSLLARSASHRRPARSRSRCSAAGRAPSSRLLNGHRGRKRAGKPPGTTSSDAQIACESLPGGLPRGPASDPRIDNRLDRRSLVWSPHHIMRSPSRPRLTSPSGGWREIGWQVGTAIARDCADHHAAFETPAESTCGR